MRLRKATRQKAKIRLGLSAVSGGGKTYSALLIGKGIAGSWDKVAIIDSENYSADLYAHLGDYNVLPIAAPFTPEKYIEAIKECEKAGMEVIIVDSITHEWDGKGGCLEIVESLGGKYQDWAKVTPRHQAFIEAITQSPCHIITTVRRKQDYEMIKDNNGKVKVEKAGLKEVTREGFEYELTINLELDMRHNATASKDRTGLFTGKPAFTPNEQTGELIRNPDYARTLRHLGRNGADDFFTGFLETALAPDEPAPVPVSALSLSSEPHAARAGSSSVAATSAVIRRTEGRRMVRCLSAGLALTSPVTSVASPGVRLGHDPGAAPSERTPA